MHHSLSRKTYFVFLVLTFSAAVLLCACTSHKSYPARSKARPTTNQPNLLNINRATADDLAKIPHIGPSLARRIVEHRDRYGPYRTVDQLLLIEGVGESRFREFSPFLTVD